MRLAITWLLCCWPLAGCVSDSVSAQRSPDAHDMGLLAQYGGAVTAQAETDKRVLEDTAAQAAAPQAPPRLSCTWAGHPYAIVARC